MQQKQRIWRNYVLYYGYGLEDQLSRYDLVIVESNAHGKDFPAYLEDKGATPVAYLSGFEYPHYQPDAGQKQSLFGLSAAGWTPSWTNNYLMDLRDRGWREHLADETARMLRRGYQGIFLDTLGVCQMPGLGELPGGVWPELIDAAGETVHYLRTSFPDVVLIQNGGLAQLKQKTAEYIDAICWESFHLPLIHGANPDAWSRNRLSELTGEGVQTLLLTEDRLTSHDEYLQMLQFAAEQGFLSYRGPRDYVAGIYDPDRQWHSAPKMMATR